MKFAQLKKHIEAGQFFPCYIATGEDYTLVRKAEEILSAVIEIKELNISLLGADIASDAAEIALSTLPFMSKYRLVVADGINPQIVTEYLKNPAPTTILLVKENGGTKGSVAKSGTKKESVKDLKGAEVIDCSRLETPMLVASIKAECEKNGVSILDSAAALLAEYCLRFMGRIKSELYKLIDYKEGRTIEDADVRAVVLPDLEYKVFELSSAIVRGDSARALGLLGDMLAEGYGAAAKIFGLLYAHFRRLFAAALSPNDPNLANYLEVKDFAVKAAVTESRNFSKLRLKTIVDSLHKLDADIKSGRVSDRIGFETFVMQTCAVVSRA